MARSREDILQDLADENERLRWQRRRSRLASMIKIDWRLGILRRDTF